MSKTNTCKSPTLNSVRSKKRAKRGFKLSRPNRRAERRHGFALGAYQAGINSGGAGSVTAFTNPGKEDKW